MAFSAQRGVCENKTLTEICTVQFNSKFRFFNTIIHTVYTGMPRTRVNFSLHFAMSNRVEHLKFIFVYLYMYWCICICVFLSVLFVQSLLYCGKTLAWDSRQTSLDTPRQVEQFPNFPLKYLKYLKYFAKTFRYLQQVEQFTNLPFINVFEILEMYLANKFGHLR